MKKERRTEELGDKQRGFHVDGNNSTRHVCVYRVPGAVWTALHHYQVRRAVKASGTGKTEQVPLTHTLLGPRIEARKIRSRGIAA